MKYYTAEELALVTGGILNKVEDAKVCKLYPPLLADEETLALALNEEEIANLAKTKAKIAIVPLGAAPDNLTTIEVERPRLAMMKLLTMFYVPPTTGDGIHPSAVVYPTAKLGQNVSLGPNVVVAEGAEIGDNTRILANAYIGEDVKIGKDCLFHAGVNIGKNTIIGDRVIINHGASIGADGFSFVTETPDNIENAKKDGEIKEANTKQVIYKIPSLGGVKIGNDVEIGANACIDKGTIEYTTIGDQTKIDDLVMIGHNCKVGKACMIVSQSGVAGSCVIGDRVVIAGQAGLADHITVGSDSIVMAQAGVSKSFPEKSIIVGAPAVPRKEFIRQLQTMKKAEQLIKKFQAYEKVLNADMDNDESK
ncbi:MAG: UDP-3-O-(3-hydroxymyristoyl)glucosamine N-acyltransferase [Candidatus Gastranaerophilales bacterium]|nr:UDP-3-O-(3-hydroxymyristoyl)glucosamine N-acyltransferase [Candidatus Gastranaerophilales bacterium]